jgi:hypothetical protein
MREHVKIDNAGLLHIRRHNDYKKQGCPLDKDGGACGDWCPLFREPHASPNTGTIQISLCQSEIICDTFVDERKKPFPFTIEVFTPCCGNTRFVVIGETNDEYLCEGNYKFKKKECRIL